ncbi:GNAT family N-acetyltransferase [Candidatus Cloacimonadota bacterium]
MIDKMKFRRFKIDDYDLLISIWKAAGLPYRPQGRDTRANIAEEVKSRKTIFLFCEFEGKTVGVILITNDGRKGWINRLAVIPEFRNKGIGTSLIKEAERLLADQGLGIITCLIEDYNQLSRDMFKSLGYVEHKEIIYYAKRLYPEV